MPQRILVIEDNHDLAQLVELHLRDQSYQVDLAHDGDQGLERAQQARYDLIVLDLMLPGLDGLELCRRLRADADYTPILMLTAKSSELDRVLGLELGADDYLTKPFSIREFVARVKAILRRVEVLSSSGAETPADSDAIKTHGLVIDPQCRKATVHGKCVELTAREFDLLLYLARNPGRVYSRSQLLNEVWGCGYEGYEHTVNSHINRLRAKIERQPANPELIQTVWGIGYRFTESNPRR